jgi:hypothetical protein
MKAIKTISPIRLGRQRTQGYKMKYDKVLSQLASGNVNNAYWRNIYQNHSINRMSIPQKEI